MREPEVCFNMDLANAPTSTRFVREAAAVLGRELSADDANALDEFDNASAPGPIGDYVHELIDEYTNDLDAAGYFVHWDAGDVVVWDLRPFTDEEREEFFAEFDR